MIFGLATPLISSVRLDGEQYSIHMDPPPGPQACIWALQDTWIELFPRSLPEDQQAFWEERLADHESNLSYASLRPIAFDLASQLYGVPWWAAHRLTEEAAASHIAYEGWCVRRAFHPEQHTARRIISSIVAWTSEGWTDESEAKSWHQRTFMPPPGVRP